MANNKIQIKRSTANATVTGLSAGELAFTQAGNVFFIGAPDGTSGSIRIGGQMVPGTLTANQALVANATSGIDKIIVANLQPAYIYANGASGSASQVLTSNSTGGVYWSTPATSVAGTDTQVQFNDGGVLAGDAGLTYNKTTDNLTVANTITAAIQAAGSYGNTTTGGSVQNTTVVAVGNSSVNAFINSSALSIGGNLVANSTGANNAFNLGGTAAASYQLNSTLAANIASYLPTYTGIVNASSFTAGAIGTGTGGSVQNTTAVFVGNNTINTSISAGAITVNGTAVIANNSGVFTTGTVNAASVTTGTIGTGTGGSVQNTTVFFIGNNTVNAAVNTTTLYIGGNVIANSTGANNAFNLGGTAAASYQLNSTLAANVATLTANNANYLGTVAAASYVQNTDSRVLSGNLAFSGANVTFSGANLTVTGTNTYFSSNVTVAGTNAAISANLTLTGATVTGTSTDLSMRNGTFSGNLTILGTVVTVNTAQLVVNDNIIQLGEGNITTDVVDTGFFAPAGNATNIWYSGIARIAASSTNTAPVFRVFVSNTNPNTSATIDTTANTKTGFLQAYLAPYGVGGALIANATNISIASNSTLSVAITANTLTLGTALAGTSGGTGKSTMTNNAILVGNSTNGYNELTLGTSGYVLQSNGTALVYDVLDGGTF